MNCQSHTRKATIKARMTTACYILQADVKRFNQNEVNATCLLCDIGEPENIDNFLCRCSYPPIKDSRERFLRDSCIRLLHTALGFERLGEHSEYNDIVQLVLDCTAYNPDESHTHTTQHGLLSRAMLESIAMSCTDCDTWQLNEYSSLQDKPYNVRFIHTVLIGHNYFAPRGVDNVLKGHCIEFKYSPTVYILVLPRRVNNS